MQATEQQAAVEAVVRRFTEVAPPGWARLVGNWEATPSPSGETNLNYVTLAVVDGGDRWQFGQVGYDEPLYDLVAALNEGMADSNGRWTVLDLEVEGDGAYRTGFGYQQPKRSNGIHDEESMGRFENYFQTWIDEHGTVPRRPRDTGSGEGEASADEH